MEFPVAEKQSTSELWSRLGSRVREATDAHKNDEVRGGFTELPPFPSGVAKLVRVETYNDEGVLKFRAIGKMVAPMYADGGVPLIDLETAMFATMSEGDIDKALSDVLDVFRKMLGQERLSVLLRTYPHPETGYDYDKMCAALTAATVKDPIYFRCSNKFEENKSGRLDQKTGKPFPGRAWQRWQLAIPGYVPLSATSPTTVASTKSGTNGHPSAVTTHPLGTGPKSDPAPWSERKSPLPMTVNQTPPESFPLTGDDGAAEGTDWTLVGGMADGGDQASVNLLFAAAKELGYDDDDLAEAPSYGLIAGWVKSGVRKGGHSETNPIAGVISPTVGTNVKFKPADPKDKTGQTRMQRFQSYEVTEVHGDGTMTLTNIANPTKVCTGVRWNDPHVEYAK
jgi:hypothetical protein